MRNVRLTIEYDGKRYSGWQRLGDDDKTIQGKIEKVLHQMTNEKIEIIGSGGTDVGTHVQGQVTNFKTGTGIGLAEITDFMDRYLPRSIVIKRIEEMPERFHSKYNAASKKYSYCVWSNVIPSTFEWNHSFYSPQELDMDRLNAACEKLVGTRDFIGFSALKKSRKSTMRTIDELSTERKGEMFHFTFVGGGFLYKMVRITMGTLLEIGTDAIPIETTDEIFENKARQHAGEIVPTQGLFLDEAYYQWKYFDNGWNACFTV